MSRPKVYFACSINGGGDKSRYPEIIQHIKAHAELLTEVFVEEGLQLGGSQAPAADIWQRDVTWVKQADALIAEVSNPSLGVGYEIAKAEEWGKPVLALYLDQPDKKLSAMIAGSPGCSVAHYSTVEKAAAAIETFISNL